MIVPMGMSFVETQPSGLGKRAGRVDDERPVAFHADLDPLSCFEIALPVPVHRDQSGSEESDGITEFDAPSRRDMNGSVEPGRNRRQESAKRGVGRCAFDGHAEIIFCATGFKQSPDG